MNHELIVVGCSWGGLAALDRLLDHLPEDLELPIVIAQHNLAMDGAFQSFNGIICRNVMIYFDKKLQDRVQELFYESLEMFGVLALGHKESIAFSPNAEAFEELDAQEKVYRRVH